MARKPRLYVPGALYHVILRGNAQQDVFLDAADRERFYELLTEGVRRFDYRVHAFCLMTNHVHLAIQAGAQPLARAMQNLSFRYTRHFNRSHKRVGHLFQGRYKALMVDSDAYGLQLVRYIHLNPLRARLVRALGRYPHSGHLGYLGKRSFDFLTTDWVLGQFADRLDVARRRYARFVEEGIGEGRREDFYSGSIDGRILGEERFAERALRSAEKREQRVPPRLDRIVVGVCRLLGTKEVQVGKPGKARDAAYARGLIGWIAMRTGAATLTEVAHRFGRDVSTLSRAAADLEQRALGDEEEAVRLRKVQNAILQA